MSENGDPISTRCTFILATDQRQLFMAGTPGDRLELYEHVEGRPTGRVVTARVLRLEQMPGHGEATRSSSS
jgi:hypothetical protein